MPHVFTLEGLNDAQLAGLHDEPVVSFPEAGQPLAPHEAIVGPTRVATLVYGPGGTPVMYRQRFPARGPVCDYCDPEYFTAMNGGQAVIPYQPQQFGRAAMPYARQHFGKAAPVKRRRRQFGDAESFLAQQNPVVATAIVGGGALAVGAALAGLGVWLFYKVGYTKRPRPARG